MTDDDKTWVDVRILLALEDVAAQLRKDPQNPAEAVHRVVLVLKRDLGLLRTEGGR